MDRQQQVLTWTSAFVLGVSLGRWIRQWQETSRERLKSAVGRTAQWSAALRGVESLEVNGALFKDELAGVLAGKRAFSRAVKDVQPVETKNGEKPSRLYKLTEVAVGTAWFDRQIMTVLTSPAVSSSGGWLSARLRNSARGLSGPPRQVVVLGSGMDARPWRLPLPPRTVWLEVDTADVVLAKRHGLENAKADLSLDDGLGFHPLRCAEWSIHAADLSVTQDWQAILEEHGFDTKQPIVWILEGVLMYLNQEGVHELLSDLGNASCKGSTIIGNSSINRQAELLGGHDHDGACGSYPSEMIESWVSSLPRDPHVALAEAGWHMTVAETLGDITQDVLTEDPKRYCAFDVTSDGKDISSEIYFVCKKQ